MSSFDSCVPDAKGIVESWEEYGKLEQVVLLRDVRGKIRLFLTGKTGVAVSGEAVADLADRLHSALGHFWGTKLYCDWSERTDLEKKLFELAERNARLYEEDTENPVTWKVIERTVAKKAWTVCNGQEEAVWSYDDALNGRKPKVVTFYSFKGGMGRTTAMAAVMLGLARQGKTVLAVDTDIEAPGLASLFFSEEWEGTIEYLLNCDMGFEQRMEDYIRPVTDGTLRDGVPGTMYVIGAGNQDRSYLSKLARIDCQETREGELKRHLTHLLEHAIARLPDVEYILLDARAGFHDLGGIVTTQMPHGVVLFGKDSKQSWSGMSQVISSIAHTQKKDDLPMLAIVDSGCGRDEHVQEEEKFRFLQASYEAFDSYYEKMENRPELRATGVAHSPIYVPYYPLLSGDVQLYEIDGNTDIVRKYRDYLSKPCYQEMVERIMGWFDEEPKEEAKKEV